MAPATQPAKPGNSAQYERVRLALAAKGVELPEQANVPTVTTLHHDHKSQHGRFVGADVNPDLDYCRTTAQTPKHVQRLLKKGYHPVTNDVRLAGCDGGQDDIIMARPKAARPPRRKRGADTDAGAYNVKSTQRVPISK